MPENGPCSETTIYLKRMLQSNFIGCMVRKIVLVLSMKLIHYRARSSSKNDITYVWLVLHRAQYFGTFTKNNTKRLLLEKDNKKKPSNGGTGCDKLANDRCDVVTVYHTNRTQAGAELKVRLSPVQTTTRRHTTLYNWLAWVHAQSRMCVTHRPYHPTMQN